MTAPFDAGYKHVDAYVLENIVSASRRPGGVNKGCPAAAEAMHMPPDAVLLADAAGCSLCRSKL